MERDLDAMELRAVGEAVADALRDWMPEDNFFFAERRAKGDKRGPFVPHAHEHGADLVRELALRGFRVSRLP